MGPVEGANAFQLVRTLQHFRMAQRANGILVTSLPVFFHGPARELVVLRMALVVLAAVDQMIRTTNFFLPLRIQDAVSSIETSVGSSVKSVSIARGEGSDSGNAAFCRLPSIPTYSLHAERVKVAGT